MSRSLTDLALQSVCTRSFRYTRSGPMNTPVQSASCPWMSCTESTSLYPPRRSLPAVRFPDAPKPRADVKTPPLWFRLLPGLRPAPARTQPDRVTGCFFPVQRAHHCLGCGQDMKFISRTDGDCICRLQRLPGTIQDFVHPCREPGSPGTAQLHPQRRELPEGFSPLRMGPVMQRHTAPDVSQGASIVRTDTL